jgi:hypothetical protein
MGAKAIHREIQDTLQEAAYSLAQVKYLTRKFINGDLDCLDDLRPGRFLSGLETVSEEFLKQSPFVRELWRAISISLHPQ